MTSSTAGKLLIGIAAVCTLIGICTGLFIGFIIGAIVGSN